MPGIDYLISQGARINDYCTSICIFSCGDAIPVNALFLAAELNHDVESTRALIRHGATASRQLTARGNNIVEQARLAEESMRKILHQETENAGKSIPDAVLLQVLMPLLQG